MLTVKLKTIYVFCPLLHFCFQRLPELYDARHLAGIARDTSIWHPNICLRCYGYIAYSMSCSLWLTQVHIINQQESDPVLRTLDTGFLTFLWPPCVRWGDCTELWVKSRNRKYSLLKQMHSSIILNLKPFNQDIC